MTLAPELGIVPGPLLGVREDIHGSLQLLESDCGRLDIMRVLVRVCGKGETAELLPDDL